MRRCSFPQIEPIRKCYDVNTTETQLSCTKIKASIVKDWVNYILPDMAF